MGNYRAYMLIYPLSTIYILFLSFSCQASDQEREVYIVYMGALGTYSPNSQHPSLLESVLDGSSVSNSLIRSYTRSFNGFAAKLTDQERQKLASKKEVVSIFKREIYQTQTTRSWDFMGMAETTKRNPTVESDIIIGDIDSGIWPESESFNDETFGPPPKKWRGACKGGFNFTCNNKIIGARYYQSPTSPMSSARDELGHGTHTASIAAGNFVKNVSFYEIAEGTARGGVPSARIAAYRVCGTDGCFSDSVLAAFDDAIADGVDIITISLGNSYPIRFERDAIAIGSYHAAAKGILTVNSAGNNGMGLGSVTSLAPWLLSVAASSTDRQIMDKIVLGNGMAFLGHSINSLTLDGTAFPLINGTKSLPNCTFGVCSEACIDNTSAKGKIVWCNLASTSAIRAASRAGALGVILPDGAFPDISFIFPLSFLTLGSPGFLAVVSYLNSTSNPSANILKSEAMKDPEAPAVCSFSSRGPNSIAPDILKPDITAPGKEIIAAFPPTCSPSTGIEDKRSVKYSIKSGTSMACPHVAGAAAYVKAFHPDWSPSAIKSSLMTTAYKLNSTDIAHGEFAYGSGHINPVAAINPGLVYEAFEADYLHFLCSIGYTANKLRLISGHNTRCPETSTKGSPRDLNYPTLTAKVSQGLVFKVEFHRRVKNVGFSNSTYKASVAPKLEFDVKVEPDVLAFESLNEEKSFVVTVSGRGLAKNSMVSTSLVWKDGVHRVTSPIVLHSVTY